MSRTKREQCSTRFELRLPPLLKRRIDVWVARRQETVPAYNASDLVREALLEYFGARRSAMDLSDG